MNRQFSNPNYLTSILVTVFFMIGTGIFVFLTGKENSFQAINGNHHASLDLFFKYFTHAGDGIMWIPLALYCIFFKKEFILPVIIGILLSTLFTHLLKRVVYPDELRPITYLTENFPVHVVEGVKMRRAHSFPSGHTATAFTMAVLLSPMLNKKAWAYILPLLALLAGYSRVYLAQHFVTDVLAGMGIGLTSAILSLQIQRIYLKRKTSIQS